VQERYSGRGMDYACEMKILYKILFGNCEEKRELVEYIREAYNTNRGHLIGM